MPKSGHQREDAVPEVNTVVTVADLGFSHIGIIQKEISLKSLNHY